MPTCQTLAYDPEEGQVFLTARSNRAFSLYGGETVENPTNTWAILLAGYQMPDDFVVSGVEAVEAVMSSGLSVGTADGCIVIENSGETRPVEVFDISGRRIASVIAVPGITTIALQRGIYIVAGRKIVI